MGIHEELELYRLTCERCGKEFESDSPDDRLCFGCIRRVQYVRLNEYVMAEDGVQK